MSAAMHTEYVGTDYMTCRCILGTDHTREQYDAFYEIVDHDFLPVAGHPDDDECTYRNDGTDETYCGEPKGRHQS